MNCDCNPPCGSCRCGMEGERRQLDALAVLADADTAAPRSLLSERECDALAETLVELSRSTFEREAPLLAAAAIVAQAVDRLTAAVKEAKTR